MGGALVSGALVCRANVSQVVRVFESNSTSILNFLIHGLRCY